MTKPKSVKPTARRKKKPKRTRLARTARLSQLQLGFVIGAGAWLSGLTWTPTTIAATVVLGLIALGALIYVVSFVSVPSAVFFQSYTLHFYAGRYPPLGAALARAPVPASPPVAAAG